jgi:ribonuclease P protein component
VGVPVGNAVTRNRVRRRLREIMRALPVAAGWDLMLTARPAARKAPFVALQAGVEAALQKLGALA